ncbi:hypothetical protein MLD38_009491 [Melastoma candidum]|uniref:Uncharacterized protein n=1 Tax=Melastoma candidum TaxID=119954 RepID=A0ACB9RXE4_9MYRT|nr:hypothetical protein MLD38_009491 [Melastoma candidum]
MPAPPPPPPSPAPGTTLDPSNIRVLRPLGKGATGTVLLVHDSVSDPSAASPFALKLIESASSSSSARNRLLHEASVLSLLTARPHPFLPSLVGGCNCLLVRDDLVAFALPYCPGGDLHVLRGQLPDRVFSTSSLRFYLSEILSALRHLHSLGLAFRDLKLENILIQWSGHLTLADFDLSKHLPPPPSHGSANFSPRPESNSDPKPLLKPGLSLRKVKTSTARVSPVSRRRQSLSGKSYSFVGTEEYIAPEVIRGDGHGFAVDWWALGVLAYEMSFGKTPFKGRTKKETFRNVLVKPVHCPGRRTALTDLINQLLAKDPSERLGYSRGAEEIMEHEFFRGVRWDILAEIARPPFIPPSIDDHAEETTMQGMDLMEYLKRSREPEPASRCCSFSDGRPAGLRGRGRVT